MADDIVTRLRRLVDVPHGVDMLEAADEIAELRAAGDALAEALTLDLCDCKNKDCTALRNAHRRWQEARRG